MRVKSLLTWTSFSNSLNRPLNSLNESLSVLVLNFSWSDVVGTDLGVDSDVLEWSPTPLTLPFRIPSPRVIHWDPGRRRYRSTRMSHLSRELVMCHDDVTQKVLNNPSNVEYNIDYT